MKVGLFAHAKSDRPLLAIALLLIATASLGFQDSLMKLISSQTSFWQIQALRSLCNLIFIVILAALGGGLSLIKPRNGKAVYLRASLLGICMFFFFAGVPFLSVTQMAAGLYTYPLFVCALAGPMLGERIGPWRVVSMVLGVIGAAIVLSPWKASFSAVQLMPVVAGFFFACNILVLRRDCRHESTLALAFAVGLIFLGSGITGITLLSLFSVNTETQHSLPYIAIGWPALTGVVAGFAIMASVLNLLGNICMTRAYQTADASLLAPLDFTYLIFAAIWGKLLFDQWPDNATIFGMLLIICAGASIAWREHVNKRAGKVPA